MGFHQERRACAKAEGTFDVLLTADKNLRYQQNLEGRRIAILELPTNRKAVVMTLTRQIHAALHEMERSGERYVTLLLDKR